MLGRAELSTTQIYTQVSLPQAGGDPRREPSGATTERHRWPAQAEDEDGAREAAGELLAALDADAPAEDAAPLEGSSEGSNRPPDGATL